MRLSVSLAVGALCVVSFTLFGCKKASRVIAPGSLSAEESHAKMAKALAQIAKRVPEENIFIGERLAETARGELRSLPADAPPLRRWLRTYQLAKHELHLGNEKESIRLMESASALVRDQPRLIKPEIVNQFYFDTSVAFLRLGETQNCCQRGSPESCILPLQGSAIHQQQDGSRKAVEWLSALLERSSPDDDMHLAARWLLNLAYMTLGEYPSQVPERWLIPNIDAGETTPDTAWKNVAASAGVATFSLAGGAIADDFDGDHDIDIVVSSSDPRESMRIFWNEGTGKFRDGTQGSGLEEMLGGLNMVQTDYNNDGHIDIFVMRGGWLSRGGQHPNSLLRNNGNGTFTDVTITAGLAFPALPTQTASWADYDLDGDLDLFVGNESTDDLKCSSTLFRNNGDGTFADVTKQAGVTNEHLAKAVVWGDYDNDRYPDIYVSNYRGTNRLFRNLGDGTFRDVAGDVGVTGPDASFPTWFWDFNNDGQLDLFVAAYSGGIAEVAASHLGKPFNRTATLPRLYVRDGAAFKDVAGQRGLTHPTHPMGANFGDLDNDGFPDFYLGTGWPEYHELMPNLLYRNAGGQRFEDVTNASRVGHLQKGHAVAMADFDNDGDVDIFEQMGGFVPGDKFYDVLFQNPGTSGNWLKLKLIGTESNRAAIGARIHVLVEENGEERSIYRRVNSGGTFGANPLEQHIGLGATDRIDSVEIFWPQTGRTDVVSDLVPNRRLVLMERSGEE